MHIYNIFLLFNTNQFCSSNKYMLAKQNKTKFLVAQDDFITFYVNHRKSSSLQDGGGTGR